MGSVIPLQKFQGRVLIIASGTPGKYNLDEYLGVIRTMLERGQRFEFLPLNEIDSVERCRARILAHRFEKVFFIGGHLDSRFLGLYRAARTCRCAEDLTCDHDLEIRAYSM